MGIKSKLGSRFKFELIGKVVGVSSGAILTIGLARLLGPDEYGLLFLSISIFGIVKLISSLGIAKSGSRYIAQYKETNPGQLPHILRFTFLLNVLAIVLVSFVFLVSHEYIAQRIGEPDLTQFLLLGTSFVILSTLMKFSRLLLQGYENIEAASIIYATDRGARVIFAIGFVILGCGAIGALVGYILASALAAAFGLFYLYFQYYRGAEISHREPGLRRRITEYSFPLAATGTADVIDKRVDSVLVGFFIGPTGVAYYTLGKQIVSFIQAPMSALGFTLSPTFEGQKAKGNPETAARIYEEALCYGLLLYIPASAGLILTAEPFITFVFGNEYRNAVPVVQVFGIYAVVVSLSLLTDNSLDFLGRARERAIVRGITAVMNVMLNVVLIPQMGAIGAAIATVFTFSLYVAVNIYIMTLELNLRIGYLLRKIAKIIAITVLMSLAVYLIMGLVNSLLTLLAVVGLGIAIWGSLSIAFGLIELRDVSSVVF